MSVKCDNMAKILTKQQKKTLFLGKNAFFWQKNGKIGQVGTIFDI